MIQLFTAYTYQDWQNYPADKTNFISTVIASYKTSPDFKNALEASEYFRSDNRNIKSKTIVKANSVVTEDKRGKKSRSLFTQDIPGNRTPNGFFYRFVTQQAQFLLSNGVVLEDAEAKQRLGVGFDKVLARMGEKALVHGVCWGYWNKDHIECFPACDGGDSGFVALLDEVTGVPMVGIRFWRIAPTKPMIVTLYETDGVTVYRFSSEGNTIIEEKRPYIQTITSDALGEEVTGGENYNALPIIPLYANEERTSELTPSIKSKIDLYDKIMSDFGDNLDRANDVYWVLNNFGGTMDDMLMTIEAINKLKIVANTGGMDGGASAEPRTLEVPYQARQAALDLLRKALYQDFMALDMNEITGGSLTNVAIQVATANLNLKANRFEWQVFKFVQDVLKLVGVETESIAFIRQTIGNTEETINSIYTMRQDIDLRTALKLNPMISNDDIEQIVADVSASEVSGLPSMNDLQQAIDSE